MTGGEESGQGLGSVMPRTSASIPGHWAGWHGPSDLAGIDSPPSLSPPPKIKLFLYQKRRVEFVLGERRTGVSSGESWLLDVSAQTNESHAPGLLPGGETALPGSHSSVACASGVTGSGRRPLCCACLEPALPQVPGTWT